MRRFHLVGLVIVILMFSCSAQKDLPEVNNHYISLLASSLQSYRNQLQAFDSEFRTVDMPDVPFYLFGMGNREKLLYKQGKLFNAISGEVLFTWDVKSDVIFPNEYTVLLETKDNKHVVLMETEKGVWLYENEKWQLINGTASIVHLDEFEDKKYCEILKVLNQEILINIVDSKPVPNFFVYQKPWRRDAAMMAMCLQLTNNVDLIKDWVLGLEDPYDRNNGVNVGKPESEADNLGQTLYLLSFFSDKEHPLVHKILAELPKYEIKDNNGFYIKGRSDFQFVPVYQTKWLKLGLQKLGLEDPYTIPEIADNYSSLYWWGYKDTHVDGDSWQHDYYPYIGWARDHFHGTKDNPISNQIYPLTWEIEASQADYTGMEIVDTIYVEQKNASPHTWHAAEVFLYLMDSEIM